MKFFCGKAHKKCNLYNKLNNYTFEIKFNVKKTRKKKNNIYRYSFCIVSLRKTTKKHTTKRNTNTYHKSVEGCLYFVGVLVDLARGMNLFFCAFFIKNVNMKNLNMRNNNCLRLVLLTTVFFANILKSQDIVILKNGDELKAKVDEITDENIKYFKWENLNGAKYSIKKVDVFMIRYQNGYVEKLSIPKLDLTEMKSEKVNLNRHSYKSAQIDSQKENAKFKFDLFINTGESYLFDIGDFKSDFCLSKYNHKYADLGIGLSRQFANDNIIGLDLIFGLQNYNVNKDNFYYSINSVFSYPNHIDNWYADDNLEFFKTGIMPFYTFQDKQKANRLKIGLGILYTRIGAYGSMISYSGNGGFGNINVVVNSDPNWNIENIYKYEHKLSGKLGIEISLGVSYIPISTYWYAFNYNTLQTKLISSYYNVFQIKSGVGFLIY